MTEPIVEREPENVRGLDADGEITNSTDEN